MTNLEKAALDRLIEAWNAFLLLPTEHADDVGEFRHGIHALQQMIMARPVRRQINAAFQFQTKAGEDAEATTGAASIDPASSGQREIEVRTFGGATNQPATATTQRVNVHSQHEANPPGQAIVQNECVAVVGAERGTLVNSKPYVLRPHCKRPGSDDCGGYGASHCHSCTISTGEAA